VYANQIGNGDESSGDGYKYRGRGLIQLTGKANYQSITDVHNNKNPDDLQDFVVNPDLLISNIKYAIESAFIWWGNNKVNSVCTGRSDEDVRCVTLKVNGDENGLNDRKRIFHSIINRAV
jgi:predicted chitinase